MQNDWLCVVENNLCSFFSLAEIFRRPYKKHLQNQAIPEAGQSKVPQMLTNQPPFSTESPITS
jgi:hypothetical protein